MSRIQNVLLSVTVLLLASCGGPAAPTVEEVQASFALEFPSYWESVDFRILGSPAWTRGSGRLGSTARFEASMELLKPTYLVRGQSVEGLIVDQTGAPGDRITLTGRVHAIPGDPSWEVQFFLDDNPTHGLGRPMESIVTDGQVVLPASGK